MIARTQEDVCFFSFPCQQLALNIILFFLFIFNPYLTSLFYPSFFLGGGGGGGYFACTLSVSNDCFHSAGKMS